MPQEGGTVGVVRVIAAVAGMVFGIEAGETWDDIAEMKKQSATYTPIYGLGSGTYTNSTPIERDVDELSYTLTRPTSVPYTVTTI